MFISHVGRGCLLLGMLCLLAGLPACRQESDSSSTTQPDAERSGGRGGVTPVDAATSSAGLSGGDSPNAPACFPASEAVAGWRKVEPIRVYLAGELVGAVSPSEVLRLSHFRVLSAATSAYVCRSGGREQTARILVVESETPEDAYGILTCQTDGREQLKIGGETRVSRGDGFHLHSWQGRNYIRVSVASSDSETTEQVLRLMIHLTGRITREDRPPLIDAMPADADLLENRWLVRHLGSLPLSAFEFARAPDSDQVSKLLGLNESTLMCVGRYRVPEGQGPNVVWLVQYPTNKAAYDAHARYTQLLSRQKDDSTLSTNLLPPHGAYLVGTWTAEEESMQYMMPRIAKLLPY